MPTHKMIFFYHAFLADISKLTTLVFRKRVLYNGGLCKGYLGKVRKEQEMSDFQLSFYWN